MYLKPSCISFCHLFTAFFQIMSEKLVLWDRTISGKCLFHEWQANETWLFAGRGACPCCQGSSSSSQHSQPGLAPAAGKEQHRLCLSPPLGQQMNHLDFSKNAFLNILNVFFQHIYICCVFCLFEALLLMYYDCFMH